MTEKSQQIGKRVRRVPSYRPGMAADNQAVAVQQQNERQGFFLQTGGNGASPVVICGK